MENISIEKRIENFLIPDRISRFANNSTKYKKFLSSDDLKILIFMVLEDIENCNTNDEICTLKKLTNIMKERHIQNINVEELVSDIVINCFQNGGNVMDFSCNISDDLKMQKQVKIVTDKFDSQGNIIYELSYEALSYLYSTKEFQEGPLTTETIKFTKYFDNNNYKKALLKINNILRILKIKKKEIEDLRAKALSNLSQIHKINIDKNLIKILNELQELFEEYKHIHENILNKINKIPIEDTHKEATKEIKEILKKVNLIITTQNELINDIHSIRNEIKNILKNTEVLKISSYINIEKDIINPIVKGIINPLDFLKLFVGVKRQKILDINSLLKERAHSTERLYKEDIIENNEIDENIEEIKLNLIKEEKEKYKRTYAEILDNLILEKSISLKELFEKNKLNLDLISIQVVLLGILHEEKDSFLYFNEDYISSCDEKFNASIDYDKSKIDLSNKKLKIEKGNEQIIINENNDKTLKGISIDNLIFTLLNNEKEDEINE